MRLKVITVPHVTLKTKALPVEQVNEEVVQKLSDMLETMYASNGVGIAANQVDCLMRLVVMDCSKERNAPIKMINPVITMFSKEKAASQEGCLSIPGVMVDVERSVQVKGHYQDEFGVRQEFDFSGLLAFCIQHEIDHLNGVCIIDYLSRPKRQLALEKMGKRS